MKFRTTILSTAVAAAIGTVAGTAQAVNLGADGQGQVLIYPYYTVQSKTNANAVLGGASALDTMFEIINSDASRGKAVKVRILEGKNSMEVLDFNLYLSPSDVFTAVLTRRSDGQPGGALRTSDNSCTAPEIPLNGALGAGMREVVFKNDAYALNGPGPDAALDIRIQRGNEGYIEVIQMADVVSGLVTNQGLSTFNSIKHVGGVPPGCAAVRAAWLPPDPLANDYNTPANDGVAAPTGMLSGSATVINAIEGADMAFDAVAIDRFSAVPLHFAPGSIDPQLTRVNPPISAVFQVDGTGAQTGTAGSYVVTTNWAGQSPGILPVSALFMRDQVVNNFAQSLPATANQTIFQTDWVVNFPTKRFHIDPVVAAANMAPFTQRLSPNGACELVSLGQQDREEQQPTSSFNLGFSPPTNVLVPTNSLCWEVNVVSINYGTNLATASNVLGSATQGTPTGAAGGIRSIIGLNYLQGWLRMGFAQTRVAPAGSTTRTSIETGVVTVAPGTTTYTGLPVMGFAAISAVSTGAVANVNYGSAYTHRFTRSITP